jgi:hypothetical protein
MFANNSSFFRNASGNNCAKSPTSDVGVGSGKSLMPGESYDCLEDVLADFEQAIKSLSGQFSALPPGAKARSACLLKELSNARDQLHFQLSTNFTTASPAV